MRWKIEKYSMTYEKNNKENIEEKNYMHKKR